VNGPSSTRRLGDVDPGRPPVPSTGGRQLSDLDGGAPAGRSLRSTGDPDRRAGRPPAGLDTGPTGRRDPGPLDTGPAGRRDPGRRDSGRPESSRLDTGPTGRREPLIDPGAPGASGRRQAGARPLRGATAAGAAGLSGLPGRDDPLGAGTGVRRPTGENPAFADRLDGLVSRATPPHGHREGAPAPRPRDPLAAPRPEPRGAPPPADELPPTAPVPVARPPARPAPGPGPAPSVVPAPGRRPPYEPGYEEPYDDGYGVDGYDDSYGDEPYDEFDEDEPVDPERRSGCGRPVMILAGAGVLMVLVLLVAMFWVRGQIDPGGEPGDTVRVEIVAGQSTGEIGTVLEEAGVISSATLWPWYVRFKGGGDIQAGVYEIPTNLSMGEALDALADKPLPPGTKRVTIPEGQTIGEIRARVTEGEQAVAGFTPEGFDAALADPVVRSKHLPADQESLEGTFYPETYDLAEDATEVDLLTKMRDEFDATMDELGVDAGAEAVGLSPYEVLIVASIIEEEARVDEDRPRVARVIYNRLAEAPRLLFIDAINCYGAQMVPCIPNELDFEAESPYNSRKTPGLPPTPIAAPSRKSIEAALHPAEGPWTYYVLDPDLGEGRHLFTDSEQEFEAAKDRCRDAGLGCG
jgi:UPF0755 protein